MDNQRTIIVGDIHGCIEEFNELVRTIQYNPYKDRLILVGDLIDRGPDSVGVVRRAQELGAQSVLANHEMKYIKYRKHELKKLEHRHYKNPMFFDETKLAIYNELNDTDWAYINNMPSYIKLTNDGKDTFVVHAGFEPYIPIQRQHPAVMAMVRFVDEKGKMASNLFKKVPGRYDWTEKWCREEDVVYGHMVHSLDAPRIDKNQSNATCYGIDLGCCFGGHLCAMILETKEIIKIKAKKVYAELRVFD